MWSTALKSMVPLLMCTVGIVDAAKSQLPRAAASSAIPRTVTGLWSDFDPCKEPLQAQTVREWTDDGITYRYVTFYIGTFKGRQARMAAFYAFPQGGEKLPGLLHLHGGGQRAFLHEVEYYAQRGYACLSINWGGREMENSKPSDPNTDWGAVDPTQRNVSGYFNLKPGVKYLDAFESPRNNNWYLLTIGARRGLTFLAQQTKVDAGKLGVYGHSMGGNLTVYVAGTDKRIKVAAPSAGGQGFRTVPWKLLPQQRRRTPHGDMRLFRNTLGFQSYAPHIKAPLLWLGATNDFHGIMDDTYRTGDLIPKGAVRYSFAPHLNHRFTPAFAVTRPLWLDQHLKSGFKLPMTPTSTLSLVGEDGVPALQVIPDQSKSVEQVCIYYSIDPDPQARYWRSADARRSDAAWNANLPIMNAKQPLFAFANIHYRLTKPEPVQFAQPTRTFAISSLLHRVTPEALQKAHVKVTDVPTLLIDDFSNHWRDWYRLSADNPHHWHFWTRKISDPKWQGKAGYVLELDAQSEKTNELVVVLTENFFRSYRGKQRDYVAVVKLEGGDGWQPIRLRESDFKGVEGDEVLTSWQRCDLLGLRAYYRSRHTTVILGSVQWSGEKPQFRNLHWVSTADKPSD